jgi:hypothetical protein
MNRKPASPSISTAEFNKAAHDHLAKLRTQRTIQRLRVDSLSKPRNVPAFRASSMVLL